MLVVALPSAARYAPAQAPRAVVERGAKVRLTLVDTAGFPRGSASGHRIEARFASFDSSGRAVIVRLYTGDYLAVPDTGVRRFEVRSGRGFCAAGRRNRVACLVGGLGAGYLLGYAVGRVVESNYVGNPREWQAAPEGRARVRGAATLGSGLGVVTAFTVGRDQWVRVAGWPPPRP